uniref:RNA-directed DNA polymerase n=1 Tax=Strongyloides papillosus TaxID=174720 RepID=A0A0N5BMZ0_STREA
MEVLRRMKRNESFKKNETSLKKKKCHLCGEVDQHKRGSIWHKNKKKNEITKVPLTCLVDTGSTRIITTKSVYRAAIKKNSCNLKPVIFNLADGSVWPLKGVAEISLKFGSVKVNVEVGICRDEDFNFGKNQTRYSVMLGSDVLTAANANLNYGTNEVMFENILVPSFMEIRNLKKKEIRNVFRITSEGKNFRKGNKPPNKTSWGDVQEKAFLNTTKNLKGVCDLRVGIRKNGQCNQLEEIISVGDSENEKFKKHKSNVTWKEEYVMKRRLHNSHTYKDSKGNKGRYLARNHNHLKLEEGGSKALKKREVKKLWINRDSDVEEVPPGLNLDTDKEGYLSEEEVNTVIEKDISGLSVNTFVEEISSSVVVVKKTAKMNAWLCHPLYEDTKDVGEWLDGLKMSSMIDDVEERKCTYLAHLRGNDTIKKIISSYCSDVTNWSDLKTILVKRCGKGISKELSMMKLKTFEFKVNEGIKDQVIEFGKLIDVILPDELSSDLGMDIKKLILQTYLRDHNVLWNRCNDGKHDNMYELAGDLEMTWARKKSSSGNNFHGRKKFIDKKDNVKTEIKGSNGKCFGCGEAGHYKNNCPKSGDKVKKINGPVENAKRVEQLENMIEKLLEKEHFGEFVRRTNDLKNGTLVDGSKLTSRRADCKAEFYLPIGISYGSEDVKFKPVVGLVDTGSTKCIISRSTANLIGISCDFLRPKTYSLANNSSWRVLGEVEVQIKVGKNVVDVQVAVVPDSEVSQSHNKFQMLLGSDLLKACGIVIDFKNMKMYMDDKQLVSFNEVKANFVRLVRNVRRINIDMAQSIVKKFPEVMSREKTDIGECTISARPILFVEGAKFPKITRFNHNYEKQKIIAAQIKEWKNMGVLEEADAQIILNVTVVRKKEAILEEEIDGNVMQSRAVSGWRTCIDGRLANKILQYVSYGTKVLSQRLSQLQGATKFSNFDLRQFYLQVKMADVNLNQFGVQCPISNKVFALRRIPFDKVLMMAEIEICKTLMLDGEMEKIAPERKFGLFSYQDDIVFFTKKELESSHFKMVEIIFQTFKQVNLKINVAKMSLNVDEIQFLNFMVSAKGLAPCLEYVKAIQEVQAPVGKKSLQRFIGMVQYYRIFIDNITKKQLPLLKLLEKNSIWKWGKEEQNSFEMLKMDLINAAQIKLPDVMKRFYLFTDCSKDCEAGVLAQEDEEFGNALRPCAFYSKRLHCSGYTPSVLLELRALCNSLLYFKKLVGNAQVIAKSDHKPLISMLTNGKESSSKFMKYINLINEFGNVEVMFIEGKKNIPADFLSRAFVRKVMVNDSVKDSPPDPNKMKEIFHQYHDCLGHASLARCTPIVLLRHNWIGIKRDLANYIDQCSTCKVAVAKYKERMKVNVIVPSRPLQMLAMDVSGPHKISLSGHKYVLGVVDVFSKYLWLFPLCDIKTSTISKELETRIFIPFSSPIYMRSDCASTMLGGEVKTLMEKYNVIVDPGIVGYKQSNCMIERCFRSLNITMRKSLDNFDLWNEVVWSTMYSYNRLVHGTTLHTPYEIMFGQKPILKSDDRKEVEKIADFKDNEIIRSQTYLLVEQLIEAVRGKRYDEDSYEVTRCGNDDKLNVTDKPLGDLEKKSPLKKLKVGDRVIIRDHTSGKWDVIYSGGNDNAYIVKSLLKNGKNANLV